MAFIALVVSDFNREVTSRMEAEAGKLARELGAEVAESVHVPGVYDTPLAVLKMLRREDIDCVAVLGVVIKGETGHDEVIANAAAKALTGLSLESGKPVGLGVIGPGATRGQAEKRAEEYARRAVKSAIDLCRL